MSNNIKNNMSDNTKTYGQLQEALIEQTTPIIQEFLRELGYEAFTYDFRKLLKMLSKVAESIPEVDGKAVWALRNMVRTHSHQGLIAKEKVLATYTAFLAVLQGMRDICPNDGTDLVVVDVGSMLRCLRMPPPRYAAQPKPAGWAQSEVAVLDFHGNECQACPDRYAPGGCSLGGSCPLCHHPAHKTRAGNPAYPHPTRCSPCRHHFGAHSKCRWGSRCNFCHHPDHELECEGGADASSRRRRRCRRRRRHPLRTHRRRHQRRLQRPRHA